LCAAETFIFETFFFGFAESQTYRQSFMIPRPVRGLSMNCLYLDTIKWQQIVMDEVQANALIGTRLYLSFKSLSFHCCPNTNTLVTIHGGRVMSAVSAALIAGSRYS
jgi:hypothetical protein